MEEKPDEAVPDLAGTMQKLILLLERTNIQDYIQLLQKPWRLFLLNFGAGIARGFGIALGLTIVASVFIMILSYIATLHIPLIGTFIAKIVWIVNKQLADLPS